MPFIIDILNILKYIQAIYDNNTVNKDDILIKIIKAPYWNVERSDIFELSYIVKSQNINWLEAIKNYKSTTQIYNCILEISDKLEKTNLSNLIHSIINISEFKKYYFDKKNKDNYYKCLEALRALYEAIEEYDTDDIFTFLKIYEKYNLPILITAPTNTESNVTLLTAHRAKGLEFDIVFIIDTDDKIWKKNNRPNIAPVPKYLKQLLSPIDEDDNDNIRLLFVAASRAKTQLYVYAVEHMSRYLPTEHITNTNLLNVNIKNGLSEIDKIIAIENSLIKYDYNLDEINILKQLLHNYQMSPTHFNNFLRKNGPQYFLEVNLLRFPQPLDITGLYGSAIHSAIEYMVTEYRIKKDKPVLENVLNDFKIKMERHRYDKVEINKQINRGLKVIKNYYNNELDKLLKSIDNDGDIEVNLSHEHIIYTGADGGEAHITGKLDFIYIDKVDNSEEGIINVLDWKTGKTLYSWDKGLDINEKEKALRYKYQLMFYKLLLEQSPKYSKYIVGKLGLQFVEDKDIHTLYYEQNQEEYNEFCKLVVDVYQDIINMRF